MGNNNNPNPGKEAQEEAMTEMEMRQRVEAMNNVNSKSAGIVQSFNPGSNNLSSVSADRESFLRNSQNQELGQKNDKNYAYVVGEPRDPNDVEKLIIELQFGEGSSKKYKYLKYYSNNTLSDAVPSLESTAIDSTRVTIENILPEALFDTGAFVEEINSGTFITIEYLDKKNNQNAIVTGMPGKIGGSMMPGSSTGVSKKTPLAEIRKQFFVGENPKQDIFDRNSQTRDLKNVTEFIIHETTSFTSVETSRTLLRKGLGVHYLVSEAGAIQQTGTWNRILGHAGSRHNAKSIGVEVVTPFYAEYEKTYANRVGKYWKNITNYAPWAHVREGSNIKGYIFPTQKQMESTWTLTQIVTSSKEMNIPMKFLGYEKENNRFVISGIKHYYKASGPGIYAHSYFGHSDGAVLVLYCFLRYKKMSPQESYRACIELLKKGNLKYAGNNYYADLNIVGVKNNV